MITLYFYIMPIILALVVITATSQLCSMNISGSLQSVKQTDL